MSDIINYVSSTLFSDDHVCNFYEEVIIDNIPCYITMKYTEDENVRLIIHAKNIHKKLGELLNDEDDDYLYNLIDEPIILQLNRHLPTSTKYQIVMEQLNNTIRDIRFSKYHGKFLNKNTFRKTMDYSIMHESLQTFFKDNTNITFKKINDDAKCCICYEPTITTGCCTHPVCIPCVINIKPDEDDDILCPICRDVLLFV